MTGGVNIGCVSLLARKCSVCLCVCVCVCVRACVISNQSTSKKPHLSDLSKLDALLHKIHIKVFLLLRYQGLTCVDP